MEVLSQLDSLGYDNIMVRILSSYKFLLTFIDKDEFKKLDMDLPGLGFVECNQVQIEDLILQRKIWVKCLGLPIMDWEINTFKELTKDLGELEGILNMLNENFQFQAPRLCISTGNMEKLNVKRRILVDGREYLVTLREVHVSDSDSHIRKDYEEAQTKDVKIMEKELCSDEDLDNISNIAQVNQCLELAHRQVGDEARMKDVEDIDKELCSDDDLDNVSEIAQDDQDLELVHTKVGEIIKAPINSPCINDVRNPDFVVEVTNLRAWSIRDYTVLCCF